MIKVEILVRDGWTLTIEANNIEELTDYLYSSYGEILGQVVALRDRVQEQAHR